MTAPQSPTRRVTLVAVAVAVIVAADQATKSLAVARWSEVPQQIIGHDVELFVTRNSGSAFSRFQNLTPLLAVGAMVVAFVLARAARKESDRITLYALVLLLGGALGNLLDRLHYGHVVDWVDAGIGNMRWYTFNVADAAISFAILLLLAASMWPALTRRAEGAT